MARRPLVISHRGIDEESVPNSLPAFERAIATGVDMIEFDVRRTGDGALVLCHDPAVGETPLAELTRAEAEARLGGALPTLDELLAQAGGRVGLNAELKEDGYVPEVLARLAAGAAGSEVLVSSFHDAVVGAAAAAKPAVRTGLVLRKRDDLRVLPARLERCGADVLLPHKELLPRMGRPERPLVTWTILTEEELAEHFADGRVEGVITDIPRRALALRGEGASRDGAADR